MRERQLEILARNLADEENEETGDQSRFAQNEDGFDTGDVFWSRDQRNVPFLGSRGKKSNIPPTHFIGSRGKKNAFPFLGSRGKKISFQASRG